MKPARIIVLVIAIAAGGIAALLAGRSDQPPAPPAPVAAAPAPVDMVDVLIANNDINTGTAVSPQDMRWQAWPAAAAGPVFLRKGDRPDAINQLAGAIARGPFFEGEPIREAKLIKANGSGYMAAILPTGMRAVSIDISPETGAGGFILPNDHVDVILTKRDHDAEKANGGIEVRLSETILSNMRVLAIDQTVEDKNGQRVVVGKTATLEVSPDQAETLTVSRQIGTLSLALRSLVDSGPQPRVASRQANDAITVYRGLAVESIACNPNCDKRQSGGVPAPAPEVKGSAAP
jgi:pilus assembly protein CpaB